MGVKSLKQLIKSKAPELFKTVDLGAFSGKVIAIDTSIFLYRFMYVKGDKFLDFFVKQILRLYKNNILPLFVFDGKPPAEKSKVLKERKDEKIKMQNRIDELEAVMSGEGDYTTDDVVELKKLKKKLIYITKLDNDRCKKMLDLMGVPYVVANGEAEGLCVKLTQDGYAEGCLSEDTDVLANGGKIFLRDFSVTKNTVVACYYKELLEKLELTEAQFRDVCILCGCDYTEKIAGIGHVNAYKIIKKHDNLETFIDKCCEWINDADGSADSGTDGADGGADGGAGGGDGSVAGKKKYQVGSFFKYKEARSLFATCGAEENTADVAKTIVIRKPDIGGILAFLQEIGSTLDLKTLNLIQNKLILNYQNIMKAFYNAGKTENIVMTDYNEYNKRIMIKKKRKSPKKVTKVKIAGENVEMKDGSLESFLK